MTLAFLDLETTGLDPNRHDIWEIGLIVRGHRSPKEYDGEWLWQIQPDLTVADPTGLRISRYYERFNHYKPGLQQHPADGEWVGSNWRLLAKMLDGAHIVGAVPSFDAAFLERFLRRHGQAATWHYHLIDVEAMAAGYLSSMDQSPPLPWRSDDLARACGVEPPSDDDRHTALGDARWAERWYDAMTAPTVG